MKINFQISGGFANFSALNGPFHINTEHLDRQTANQLESLVLASRFFDQPAIAGAVAKGAADYRTYTITIEDGLNTHTIQLADPIKDEDVAQLVLKLKNMPHPSKQ